MIKTYKDFINEGKRALGSTNSDLHDADGHPKYTTNDPVSMDYSDMMNSYFSGTEEAFKHSFDKFKKFYNVDIDYPHNVKDFMKKIEDIDPGEGEDYNLDQIKDMWKKAGMV